MNAMMPTDYDGDKTLFNEIYDFSHEITPQWNMKKPNTFYDKFVELKTRFNAWQNEVL